MLSSTGRFSRLRRLQAVVFLVSVLGAALALAAALLGDFEATAYQRLLLAVVAAVLLFLALILWTFAALVLKVESTATRQFEELRDLTALARANAERLSQIVHNTSISDAAKSLAHREGELDALRVAIREDIRVEKWELASMLIEALDKRFNCPEEAELLRGDLRHARQKVIDARMAAAVALIERHFAVCDWQRAQGEIQRLQQIFPADERVAGLAERRGALMAEHKQQLLYDWEAAVQRNDVDRAIDLLKELDQYITREEAQSLHDSARHVFKEKLFQLGAQFRFAVTERRWQNALDTGLELIREFPNARMADEVRSTLDILRERARQIAETAGR